jgi:hypothetical protein
MSLFSLLMLLDTIRCSTELEGGLTQQSSIYTDIFFEVFCFEQDFGVPMACIVQASCSQLNYFSKRHLSLKCPL